MLKVALATYSGNPQLCDDDRLLLPEFDRAGVSCTIVVWDDPTVNWMTFDTVVLRSCWDYHLRPQSFIAWLKALDSLDVVVFNAVSTLLGNIDKRYLRGINADDVVIPESYWITAGSQVSLEELIVGLGWNEVVIKPTVSASAFETWRSSRTAAPTDEDRFRSLVDARDAVVQRFMPEIMQAGELSLVFIAGGYSHAIVKRPRQGDFRVQEDFGGSRHSVTPPDAIAQAAERIVRLHAPTALYARVDGIVKGDKLVLMELELIDPMLFFGYSADAPHRFVAAVQSFCLGSRGA
jgi:hypothetical protein